MAGRGAWPVAGTGGTLNFEGTKPGPYYRAGVRVPLKWQDPDPNRRAVHGAVLAIQRGLNRRLRAGTSGHLIAVDGWYGQETRDAMSEFQAGAGIHVWGGAGDETLRRLFMPDLRRRCRVKDFTTFWYVVAGVIYHESHWDPGAVGYVDDRDLGLAQINGPSHPDLSERERLAPQAAFDFVIDYLSNAMKEFDNRLPDAVASYNLGIGGARRWIDFGRPRYYTPPGSTTERDMTKYIDSVLHAPR